MSKLDLTQKVTNIFNEKFNNQPANIALAPGRINIIGEHTDYNLGLAMPIAIDRWICVLIGFFIVSSILYFLEKDFLIISILFSVILLIELYFPYSTYFQLTSITDYNIEFGNFLKGAAGNKNISAASILIKTPFLFYLINETKNLPTRIILALISSSAFYLIFLLSARAAILSTIFLLIILLIFNLIRYYKTKNPKLFFNSILYLILPILFSASAFQFQYGSKDNTVSLATRVSSVNTTDESTLQRLRFYKHSFTQIFNNPIFGVGSGNWKVKSIDYDKKQMEGFTVPYHVHNDFLEIGTELGLIGLFIYLAIFIYTVVFVLKQLSKETKLKELAPQALILLLGGVIYFTDANLNFPFARPVNQIPFIVYLALFFSLKTNSLSDEKI